MKGYTSQGEKPLLGLRRGQTSNDLNRKGYVMDKKVIAIIQTFDGPQEVEGRLTTDHAASSSRQPVFVDQDGQAYDRWQVVKTIDMD